MNTSEKKKVLFVIDTLELGGAEQSLLENAIRFKQINPVVCHLYAGETLRSKFTDNGIKVYSLNIKKKYAFVKAYTQLKKIVATEKPDLMVPYLTRSEIVSRLIGWFNNVPVVGTFVNDLYCSAYNQHLSWRAKTLVRLFKLINKLTSKICIGFIANSQTIKEANSKHLDIPLDKIEVINRGRDSLKIKCRDFAQTKTNGSLHFLNVSRLYPVKGQRELILGFKKFLENYPNATLHIIGDGPLRKELSKIIDDNALLNKIFLPGARNDVRSILAEYDCFIFPSLVEGFSGAVVEAMFAGLPVLASNIPQNAEAITHLQTGYLFPKGSIEEIEKAMLWYKDNILTANAFAIKAYEFAKENFEQANIVMRFEKYLHNSIARKN